MSSNVLHTPEEVAKILKISRFTVYELIKRGDLHAYRIGRSMRIEDEDIENYKRKSRSSNITTPPVAAPVHNQQESLDSLIICGQDSVLDVLASHLGEKIRNTPCLRRYVGSIPGLISLYNGSANVATAHLWDGDNDEYNVPYVRRFLPGYRTLVINLAYRMEGFYVATDNPKKITDWSDLTRPDICFVNRERGAGARVLLDEKLRKLGIDSRNIKGYEKEEPSHLTVASCVARGEADVALGIEKAAMQVLNVDFIPLQKERYDLVILKNDMEKPQFQAILSILESSEFRKEIAGMGGYDVSQTGKIIAEI